MTNSNSDSLHTALHFRMRRHLWRLAVAGFAVAFFALPRPSLALEADKNETARLQKCEADICGLILKKKPAKGRLGCKVSKTWIKGDIKKGAEKKDIGWSFGDAQCKVKLILERSEVVGALKKPKFEIRFRRHYVDCVVENESSVDTVHVALAPKVKFKNGRVTKVWVNVKEVKAPPLLSSLIWTTAKLEDGLGLFHGEMVDEMNDFIHKKCEKRHGVKAKAKAKALARLKAKKARAKKAKARRAKARAQRAKARAQKKAEAREKAEAKTNVEAKDSKTDSSKSDKTTEKTMAQ